MNDKNIRLKKQRIDGRETRMRLLEAASKVFAEKGFRETTNADICKKAHVNTASVNYHFGSKEELYVEAWKYSFDKSLKKHPPDGGISPEASAQERLRGRIYSFMQRVSDPETYELQITHKEMACPTGYLRVVLPLSLEVLRDGFKSVVTELLGKDASEQDVNFCNMNVVDMCFGVVMHLHRGRIMKEKGNIRNSFSEKDVKTFANHVLHFSLAGIRSIREKSVNGAVISKRKREKNKSRSRSKF
jgi:AcrR family transcriptional regulator